MVARTLVDEAVQGDEQLVQELRRERVSAKGAAWFFLQDEDEWRLLLAMDLVDEKGPLAAYHVVQLALDQVDESVRPNFIDISVVSPSDPRILALRKAVRTPKKNGSNLRLTRNWIDDVFVEDALVYRLN